MKNALQDVPPVAVLLLTGIPWGTSLWLLHAGLTMLRDLGRGRRRKGAPDTLGCICMFTNTGHPLCGQVSAPGSVGRGEEETCLCTTRIRAAEIFHADEDPSAGPAECALVTASSQALTSVRRPRADVRDAGSPRCLPRHRPQSNAGRISTFLQVFVLSDLGVRTT